MVSKNQNNKTIEQWWPVHYRRENVIICFLSKWISKTTPAGFEPTRAKPSRFRIYLLNHSDTVSNIQTFQNCTQCRDRTDDHTIKSRALCQTELIRQTEWSLADARLNTAKHTSYKLPYHDSKQHPCPLFQNFSFSPIHSWILYCTISSILILFINRCSCTLFPNIVWVILLQDLLLHTHSSYVL